MRQDIHQDTGDHESLIKIIMKENSILLDGYLNYRRSKFTTRPKFAAQNMDLSESFISFVKESVTLKNMNLNCFEEILDEIEAGKLEISTQILREIIKEGRIAADQTEHLVDKIAIFCFLIRLYCYLCGIVGGSRLDSGTLSDLNDVFLIAAGACLAIQRSGLLELSRRPPIERDRGVYVLASAMRALVLLKSVFTRHVQIAGKFRSEIRELDKTVSAIGHSANDMCGNIISSRAIYRDFSSESIDIIYAPLLIILCNLYFYDRPKDILNSDRSSYIIENYLSQATARYISSYYELNSNLLREADKSKWQTLPTGFVVVGDLLSSLQLVELSSSIKARLIVEIYTVFKRDFDAAAAADLAGLDAALGSGGWRMWRHLGLVCRDVLNKSSRLRLGAYPVHEERPYPGSVAKIVEENIVDPIRRGGSERRSAFLSAVIYGPPGSAKTTLACRIASDLGWPLVEIGVGRLLADGWSSINNRIDAIFEDLYQLNECVVLFDEWEEFITERVGAGDREARVFTTVILPKIQRLRDLGRIVFILATNRPDMLDNAGVRTGRFDIIKYLPLPTVEEKLKSIERGLETVFGESKYDEVRKNIKAVLISRMWVDQHTKYMSYGDIGHYLQRLRRLSDERDGDIDHDRISGLFMQHSVSPQYQEIIRACEERQVHDRPRE